jgi:hypothetical protein
MTEEQLQSECFLWSWNFRPETRGLIRLNLNNAKNGREGAILKGMGLQRGVADHMILISPMVWLECKLDKGTQSKEQKEFKSIVEKAGHKYHIYRSLEEFKNYVNHYLPCSQNT